MTVYSHSSGDFTPPEGGLKQARHPRLGRYADLRIREKEATDEHR